MKFLSIFSVSVALLSKVVMSSQKVLNVRASVDLESVPEFCTSNGYTISNNEYSYESAEIVCASIGKKVTISNDDNFNTIGFALAMCHGEEAKAWYAGHYENPFNECVVYNAESFFCGSAFTTVDCEYKLPVICN